jgi:biopolymer transport protein ExbB/TolQ
MNHHEATNYVCIIAFATLFLVAVAMFLAVAIPAYSKYSYCKSKGVHYGICSEYIREEFATQNIKLRVKE